MEFGLKNIIRIIVFIVTIIVVISCNLRLWEPNSLIEQDTTRSDGFYPLQIGNEWHYNRIYSDKIIYSLDSVAIIDNKKYYVIKLFESCSGTVFGRQMIREENGVVYWLLGENEYVYLDTSKEINDSWLSGPNGRTRQIKSKNDSINTSCGTICGCVSVIDESATDSTLMIFAPNIGLVYMNYNFKNGYTLIDPQVLVWANIFSKIVNL